MRRFFVPPEQSRGEVFDLPEREARHATQVLRLQPGDTLEVLDGCGGVLRCAVETATKRSVRVRVRQRDYRPPLACAITLVQAIPKGPAFETIVQKATELGAARVIPLLSERVVAHFAAKDAPAKVDKWRQIAVESIKQCGSPWLPEITPPVSFAELLKSPPARDVSVVCALPESRRSLRAVAENYRRERHREPGSAALWIGPEGDFTPAEYAAIEKTGALPISLGPLVLRADTAAIACLALANQEWQTPASARD
ncbi:MAG TPA: RsmE family RNA methyltransferase [Verrucomicrobiae bacterium]|nr:RsmE family RNA methyltransferase [Verrucomicrobiae bacterium]